MKTISKICAVALTALAIAGTASANQGGYIGGGLGYGSILTPNGSILDTSTAISNAKTNTTGGLGGRIFVGYNFKQYFGVELGWTDFSHSTNTASVVNADTTTTTAKRTAQMNEVDLVGKAYLPIKCGVSVYGLGGIAEVNEKNQVSTTPAAPTDNSVTVHKFRPKYGFGVSYDVNTQVTTALELSRVQGNGNLNNNINAIPNADMAMLTVAYNFG